MCVIRLPRQLEYDSLLTCVSNNSPSPGEKNVVDFSEVNFAKPDGVAPLAAIVNKWLNQDFDITFKRPPENSDSFTYLQRMDFFRTFRVFAEENFRRRDPQGKFWPLQEVTYASKTEDIAQKLANTLTGNNPAFTRAKSELYNCIYESINNIKDHARLGKVAGYSFVQNYKHGSDDMEYVFTTADAGRGILESLRDNSELTVDDDIAGLNLACQKSVSGAPGITYGFDNPRNMGEGLTNIDRIVESTNGYFRLLSGGAERIRRGKDIHYEEVKYPWHGTVVIVKLYKNGIQKYLDDLKAKQKDNEVRF